MILIHSTDTQGALSARFHPIAGRTATHFAEDGQSVAPLVGHGADLLPFHRQPCHLLHLAGGDFVEA